MRALVFCLVALAAYKAQGLTLSKPNRSIESAAAAIAAAAMKEDPLSDIGASGESNHTRENQLRIEKVASNMIRGLFNEAEYLKNETMNILTKHGSNATRLNYNQALKTLIAIKNMTETANALIIKAINDMEQKGYTIKNQTIAEIQSKSQNLTLTFHEDVRKAIEKMDLMNKKAHEIIDESILTLQTEGESIKNKTIDEMELASKNLTSMYQKSVEEARQTIEDMKKSLQELLKNLIEAVGTEGIAFQKDTIEAIKLQANNITEMFHKNINETMVQVDIAIKQKNEQALASIEEVRKTTSSALYTEAEGVRKNFSDHLHDVQQGLQTALDLKVQQIDGNVVEKIESAINKLEQRETQLESNLDLKKKEIVEELEKTNNKTKFEEELKSVENSFMSSVNEKLENSEESFLKKFITAITETTQSRAKVFEGTLSNEVKEYNRLLKKNKALYVKELERMKESIEAALRIAKGSSTADDYEDTVKTDVDVSEVDVKENNNKRTKENLVTKTQESTTGNSITVSKNETVVSKKTQSVSDLTTIEKKSNVSASTDEQSSASESEIGKTVILNGKKVSYSNRVLVKSSNESSIIGTTEAPEVNTRPVEKDGSSASSVSSESSSNKTKEAKIETVSSISDETHGRRNYTITTITTEIKTVYIDGENGNITTSNNSKNITLLSGDKTSATLEHSQIDLTTNVTTTSTTEAAKIESTTEAKTAETTTAASVDNVDSAKNATEKPVEIDLQITEKISIHSSNESLIVGTTEATEVNTRPVEKDGPSTSVSSVSSSNKTEEAKIKTVSSISDETHRRKNYTITTITTEIKTVYIDGENGNSTTSNNSKNITLLSGDKTSATLEHSQIDLTTNATTTSTTEAAKIESTTEAKTAETTTAASVDNVDSAKNATEKPVEIDLQTTEKISIHSSNESLIVGTTEATEVNTRPVEKDGPSTSVSSVSSSNKTEEAKIETVSSISDEIHGRKNYTITTITTEIKTVYIDGENGNITTSNNSKNITLLSGDKTSATLEHSQIDLTTNATTTSTTEAAKIESTTEAKTAETTTAASVDNVDSAKNATEKPVEIDLQTTEKISIHSSNESLIVGTTEATEVNTRPVEKDGPSTSVSSEILSNKTEKANFESVAPMNEGTHGDRKITTAVTKTKTHAVVIEHDADSAENKNATTSNSSKNITLSSDDNTSTISEHSQTDLENNTTATSTTETAKIESTTEAKTAETTTVASVDNVEPAKNATETTVVVDFQTTEKISVQSSPESLIVGTTEATEVNTRPVEKDVPSTSVSSEILSNKTEKANIESVAPMNEGTHGGRNITTTVTKTQAQTVVIEYDADSAENKTTTTSNSSKNLTLSSDDNTFTTSEHSQTDLKINTTATSTTETAKIQSTTEAKSTETTTVASVDNVEPAKNATEKTVEVDLQTTEKIPVQSSNESSIVGTTEAAEPNDRFGDEDSSSAASDNLTTKSNETLHIISKPDSKFFDSLIDNTSAIVSDVPEEKKETLPNAVRFPHLDVDPIDAGSLTDDQLIELGKQAIEDNDSVGV